MSSNVSISYHHLEYPNEIPFNPSINYPEYKTGDISTTPNHIYSAIRNVLKIQNLDLKNFDTEKWNPLKRYITENDNVLIKPNFVHNINKFDSNLISTLTHPSIIRAVIDYVLLALNNTGKIIIADAPIQGADFEQIINKLKINDILDCVKKKADTIIEVVDLRNEIVLKSSKLGITKKKMIKGDYSGYSVVDLGNRSELKNLEFEKFRVTNYDKDQMIKFHNEKNHQYVISNIALNANTIINIPKLKVHKKAGITSSLKNLIGVIGSKNCLPHHRIGSIEDGGDEYQYKSRRKRLNSKLCDLIGKTTSPFRLFFLSSLRFILKLSNLIVPYKDKYFFGNWWGNNTIPRTVVDINRIIEYSNRKGEMCDSKQRKILSIVDGIVIGEKEGPILTTPRKLGAIIVGESRPVVDIVCSNLMGFDYKKIPSINYALRKHKWPLSDNINNYRIILNDEDYSLDDFLEKEFICAVPPIGWQNHIEKVKKSELK